MHGLVVVFFLGFIALAIILLVVGLGAFQVLVIMSRAIVALIVSMKIVRSVIVAIALVALMIVMIVTTAILTVAQFTATRGRNMSRFLFLWLLLIFGNLIRNASRLVGCLTFFEEGNHLSGSEGTILFRLANLFWFTLGCTKKIYSLFSCAMGTSIVQQR